MANRVDYLLVRPFETHSFAEKMEIKRLGPHQPIDIVIQQRKPNDKKHCNRSFVVSWFTKVRWLTVSLARKGLFCFPCLLFGNDITWSRGGFYDLKHLSERIRRHECSPAHINCCLQLKLFGQNDQYLIQQGNGNGGGGGTSTSMLLSGASTSSALAAVNCKVEIEDAQHYLNHAISPSGHLNYRHNHSHGGQQQQQHDIHSAADNQRQSYVDYAGTPEGAGVIHETHMELLAREQMLELQRLHQTSSTLQTAALKSASHIDERHKAHVERHNSQVDRKHCVLAKLVDCILFCFSSGLPLKLMQSYGGVGGGGSTTPSPGASRSYAFSALFNFTATVDQQLTDDFDQDNGAINGSPTSFLTDTIHNELLDAMLQVYREELMREVSSTRFVSFLMEDFSNVLGQRRTAIVVRYLTGDRHEIVERLWGLMDEPVDEYDFMNTLTKHFSRYNLDTKLISHSHTGTTVNSSATMSGRQLQTTIKETLQKAYPYACYVQSYAQPLTVTVCKASCTIEPIRVFFANLAGYPNFFSASSRRADLLDDIGDGLRLSSLDDNLVSTVFENRRILLACFATILESDNWDAESIHGASVLQDLLHSPRFLFFLKFFHLVMPFADIIQRKLMMSDLTESSARNALKNFTTAIEWIAVNEIDTISTSTARPSTNANDNANANASEASEIDNDPAPNNDSASPQSESAKTPAKRARLDAADGDDVDNWRQAAREACNVIIADVGERFRCVNHLLAFQLVDSELFDSYGVLFPEDNVHAVEDVYPKIIASRKLRVELHTLYNNSSFKFPPGLIATFEMINKHDLRDDFSETCKLLELALTSPVATVETNRCFDTILKTRKCLQLNTEDHDDVTATSISAERLNAITVITVHADFIKSLPNFTEQVINRFSSQDHRRDSFCQKYFHPPPPPPQQSHQQRSYRKSQANFVEQKLFCA